MGKYVYPDRCPHCGMRYRDFRSGWTYADAYESFWASSADRSKWHPKRWKSVLGRLHEWKVQGWLEHIEFCSTSDLETPSGPEPRVEY
jgi:hypothetical protein